MASSYPKTYLIKNCLSIFLLNHSSNVFRSRHIVFKKVLLNQEYSKKHSILDAAQKSLQKELKKVVPAFWRTFWRLFWAASRIECFLEYSWLSKTFLNTIWRLLKTLLEWLRRKIDKQFFIKYVFGYEDAMQYKKIDLDHFLHDRKKDLAK
jgi:hypothetical protein